MFTGGVGGLVELPNFSVLVQGLDEWNYSRMPERPVIPEPRLLAAVRSELGPGVRQLRAAPWLEGQSEDPNGPAGQVGVPVIPFPAWFRCTRCNQLQSLESGAFTFTNTVASRPFEAQFLHKNCARKDRYAVPARFLVACLKGHLDEFPYAWFVHKGGPCPHATYPALTMIDQGRQQAADVTIRCASCGEKRNMINAQGEQGMQNLPVCRGRHPHLGTFAECNEPSRLLILGASNQWFGKTLNVLSVPPSHASELAATVARLWDQLSTVTSREVLAYVHGTQFSAELGKWPMEEVWEAMQERRSQPLASDGPGSAPDLLRPEWEVLTQTPVGPPLEDFALRPTAVPDRAVDLIAEVRQVERLRLVRALVGFSRFDAPDPEQPDLIEVARLSRAEAPEWIPASEVRGEGVFVRLAEDRLAAWESVVVSTPVAEEHRRAYAQFRKNRYSERYPRPFGYDWAFGWPELRYYLLHTFAHVVLRAIALECGYSSASLSERVYASRDGDNPMAGFLIFTAVPDAEGTLGGLVSLGERSRFGRILERALDDASNCSSDPLCAERAPAGDSDATHAAACHVCTFLSETSCERGNRFLDRRLLVPVGHPDLAFWRS
jgi:hypothetical protein